MTSWEELGYISLRCMDDPQTGERYIGAGSLTEWLTMVKKNKPELIESIDFLIRQLYRQSEPIH